MPIRARIVLLALVPLMAMAVLTFPLVLGSARQSESAQRIQELATLGGAAAILLDDLQAERSSVAEYVADPSAPTRLECVDRGEVTDKALRGFTAASASVSLIATEFARFSHDAGVLPRTCAAILDQARMTGVASIYARLIADLLAMRQRLADVATGDQDISDQLAAASAFTRYKAAVAEEQEVIGTVLRDDSGTLTDAKFIEYRTAIANQDSSQNLFLLSATREQQTIRARAATAEQPYHRLSARVGRDVPFDLATWQAASQAENRSLQSQEEQLDAAVVRAATAAHDSDFRASVLLAGCALGVLVVALLVSAWVWRSVTGALRALSSAATEQARLGQSVSAMVGNLARRSQLLVDRLIGLIDGLEREEHDPDRLAQLYRIDHLAARIRRTDRNLMVLSGADVGRRRALPAPLIDVLRAASAEVEQYTRVELRFVDHTAEVSADAVNDLVHLIAEILENATSYSSPGTTVTVEARRRGAGITIEVTDQGIGMSRDQLAVLNERLAGPPASGFGVARMMGLYSVGRLAARHGVKVQLREATGRGVLAIVTLPTAVLHSDQPGAYAAQPWPGDAPTFRVVDLPGPLPTIATTSLCLETAPREQEKA